MEIQILGTHTTEAKGMRLASFLIDGVLALDAGGFTSNLSLSEQEKAIEPFQKHIVGNYEVLPVPVKHSVPAVGYQVASQDGKSLFYTGDTGPGLSTCWGIHITAIAHD